MKYIYRTILIIVLLTLESTLFAQNNNCGANAIVVKSSCVTTNYTIPSSFTSTVADPACTTSYRDGWYTFTATSTNTTITVTNSNRSMSFAVYTGGCGTLNLVTCVKTGTGPETTTITTVIGTVYRIRIMRDNNANNNDMNGTICVYNSPVGPANDLCINATNLPCATTNLAGTTVNTSNIVDPASCASHYGVWYTFIGDGQITTISSTATFDHEMVISSGSCGSLTKIVCKDGSTGAETYTFTTTNGVTYYVYIAHYSTSSTTTGTFTISRTCTAPPAPTCSDGIQNGTETGIDCGGTCPACGTNHNIGSGNWNTCSGSLFDSGGSGGNYGNNQSITETYCSNAGNCIKIVFNSFSTESGYDKLSIYDGPNTSSPLIGLYQGSTSPGTITSSSGCLTFKWVTDGSTTYAGWKATISCVTCPVPTCSDGIQNGTETGIDCGGASCHACTVPADVCSDANPFCSDLVYNFPTSIDGGSAPAGPDYGCLGTQPNPVWYYLQIDGNGDLEIEIASNCGDVDYAAWGPFSATTCTNSNLSTSGNFMYEWSGASTTWEVDAFSAPSGNMVDCSYDIDAVEYLYIPNGVVGDYYMVMIINYANCDGLLTFSQTHGTGSSNCGIVLPMELLEFRGHNTGNINSLSWKTATEINNDYFLLERASDGVNFTTIATIKGAGNSNGILEYSYQDINSNEIDYYRLKQVDFDGKFDYSNIIALRRTDKNEIFIYPNPAKEKLLIDINSEIEQVYTIHYYSVLGSIVKEEISINVGENNFQLKEFIKLKPGIYFVQILNENNEVIKYQKIVKE